MSTYTLSRLFIYPVKSMRGLQISHARVLPSGLAGDRLFMVTEPDGTFITARQYPHLVNFTPVPDLQTLFITAADKTTVSINLKDFLPVAQTTEVWGNHFPAFVAPEEINQWLSHYFKKSVQLRWIGEESLRRVTKYPEVPLSFADGYPFLLINQASLNDLQQRCPAGVRMEQFRPNLVVNGFRPNEEDSWSTIRIGDVIFDVVKPCSRCILTTISPENGIKNELGEPLKTLQQYRSDEIGDIDFGQNLIARNSGSIRAGDEVEILATKPAKKYLPVKPVERLATPAEADEAVAVTINYAGNIFQGDNQQTLLEQLEAQGIRIPYSCRAGLCGCCKVKLDYGEVTPLTQSAIQEDNHILSCSCIPKTHLGIS